MYHRNWRIVLLLRSQAYQRDSQVPEHTLFVSHLFLLYFGYRSLHLREHFHPEDDRSLLAQEEGQERNQGQGQEHIRHCHTPYLGHSSPLGSLF